ncbi:hypothetical protein AGMMS50249_5890 [candidate division SR1 bacterium]|nr:hypothetical protein AGMMS50249_5890 [candidate division SR1 bacterium]
MGRILYNHSLTAQERLYTDSALSSRPEHGTCGTERSPTEEEKTPEKRIKVKANRKNARNERKQTKGKVKHFYRIFLRKGKIFFMVW